MWDQAIFLSLWISRCYRMQYRKAAKPGRYDAMCEVTFQRDRGVAREDIRYWGCTVWLTLHQKGSGMQWLVSCSHLVPIHLSRPDSCSYWKRTLFLCEFIVKTLSCWLQGWETRLRKQVFSYRRGNCGELHGAYTWEGYAPARVERLCYVKRKFGSNLSEQDFIVTVRK